MTKEQRLKKVKSTLKQLDKKGLSIGETKWGEKFVDMSPEDIAKNSKTFDNFIKVSKRAKDKPKITEQVEKLNVTIKERVVHKV